MWLLAATAGARFLGPLLQGPLVKAHCVPSLQLQLLGLGLLVPVLAADVMSPAAFNALPQPLHHGAVFGNAAAPVSTAAAAAMSSIVAGRRPVGSAVHADPGPAEAAAQEPKKSKSSGWGKSTREQSGAICKGSWLKDWQSVGGAATRRGTGSDSALPAASPLPPSQGSSALLFHLLRLLVHASGVIPGQERSINRAAAAPAPPGREAVPGTRCKIRPGPLASRNGHDDPHLIPPPAPTRAVRYLGRKISSARTEQERIRREAGEAVNF